jgi:integrase
MSGAHIRTRITKNGARRYDVRYRLGGRGYPILHGGTFKTQAEARARRDVIAGELANGRDPRELLSRLKTTRGAITVRTLATDWLEGRVDVTDSTRRVYRDHIARITSRFGNRRPETITPQDVREFITELAAVMQPGSVRNYIGTLRMILDEIEDQPNPARHRSVRLPKVERHTTTPPTAKDIDAIFERLPKRWHLPFRVLEQTGMRISELGALEWQDVDVRGSRFRIRSGKTTAARRWVQVPDWVMDQVAELVPPEDRTSTRKVFPGFDRRVAGVAMRRACIAAGTAEFSPHDLRHRYASIQVKRGVPVTELAAQLGHSRKSLTLDTYSHVLMEDE